MKKKHYLYFIIIIFLSACTERMDDLDLDGTYPRLYISGIFTTDTTIHRVELARSTDFLKDEPKNMVSEANVRIICEDDNSVIELTENPINKGVYETDANVYAKFLKSYYLDIELKNELNGHKHYQSKIEKLDMPLEVFKNLILDSLLLEMDIEDVGDEKDTLCSLNLYTNEPGETRDFYLFRAYKNFILTDDTISEYFITEDNFYNGNNTNGTTCQRLDFGDQGEDIAIGDTVTLEMTRITESYFYFLIDVITESGYRVPLFSGPPANIVTNMNNKALGFFTVYAPKRISVIRTKDGQEQIK